MYRVTGFLTNVQAGWRVMMVIAALLWSSSPIAADIEAFYGAYAGRGVARSSGGELTDRDLSVEIGPDKKGKGFVLAWSTVSQRSDGRQKRKDYRIRFVPGGRDNVYSSAMRINMFGRAVPLDPLKGDPYVWAAVSGRTLKVHALVVTEGFGYEMQTYERTLTKEGMDLKFTRVRDDERLRDLQAKLVRLPR